MEEREREADDDDEEGEDIKRTEIWKDYKCLHFRLSSRDSSVGIAPDYGLDDRGGRSSSSSGVKNFLHVVQTGSGSHPASYLMGTGRFSRGAKRPGRETDNSPPTSAEVKKMWIYTSTPPYAFMA
jgi:hypothetical protein